MCVFLGCSVCVVLVCVLVHVCCVGESMCVIVCVCV